MVCSAVWCGVSCTRSRRCQERRRRRLAEEEEDELDREREAREAERHRAKRARDTPDVMSEMMSAPGGDLKPEVSEASAAPNIDPEDPIYKAMMAAASAPATARHQPAGPSHRQAHEGGAGHAKHEEHRQAHAYAQHAQQWQEPLDHIKSGHRRELARSESPPPSSMSATASVAHAAAARSGAAGRSAGGGVVKQAALKAMFGEEEDEQSSRRKLVGSWAVGGREAGRERGACMKRGGEVGG